MDPQDTSSPYVEGVPTPEEVAEATGESTETVETTKTETQTSETQTETKTEDAGKIELETAQAKKQEEQEVKTFTQDDIDRIVKERLERDRQSRSNPDLEALKNEIKQIKESTASPGQRAGQNAEIQHPDMVKDVGEYLSDPQYRGWSMAELKEQHPDHYQLCLSRVYTKMDIDRRLEESTRRQTEQQGQQQYEGWLREQISGVQKELGEEASKYFGPDGRPNEAFQADIVQWGAEQGILNPLLAFKIKNAKHFLSDEQLEAKLEEARKEGAKKLAEKANKTEPLKKVANKGGDTSAAMADMDDDALMAIYGDHPNTAKGREARALLQARGII